MFKIKLFFVVAFFAFHSLDAQKIDLDRAGFVYQNRSLPSNPLPLAMRSYKVSVQSPMSDGANAAKAESVYIAGLPKNQTTGALHLRFNFDDILVIKSTPIERVQINKDKDGKETGRNYYYKMEILYTMNASCTIQGNDGNSIYNHTETPKRSYYTPEYASSTDAQNFWFNNNSSLKSKIIDTDISTYIAFNIAIINSKIGYMNLSNSNILWITDSPKHAENNEFVIHTKSAIAKLNSISATGGLEEVTKSLNEDIKYFESISTKYTSTEKPDMKLRYGAYYNLAMIYYCTDQFDKARQVANALIVNDFDKADGKIMINNIDRVEKSLAINNLKTTHFDDSFILKN